MDSNRMIEGDQKAQRGGAGLAPAGRQVIVICEECGKKYGVVPSRIRGSAAGFTCSRCGHRIVVAKPPEAPPGRPAPLVGAAVEDAAPPRSHRKSPGLRVQVVGIVVVLPLLVMAGAAFIFLQLQDGIAAFTQEAGITAALILGGAFLTAVLVVLVFGLRLAGRVRALADAAVRISSGDLAVEVETGSRDELGILAEAVARLRENLRRSRERMSR